MKNDKLQDSLYVKSLWCFKSLSRVLSNMIFCNTAKASEEGFSHAFSQCCRILGWQHLWNVILPIDECLFWTWKRILTHFSLSNFSSPSHDPQHHQKWLQIDLIQPFIIEHDFFLVDWVNFFFQVFTDMPYIKLVINICDFLSCTFWFGHGDLL